MLQKKGGPEITPATARSYDCEQATGKAKRRPRVGNSPCRPVSHMARREALPMEGGCIVRQKVSGAGLAERPTDQYTVGAINFKL